jgi:DNA topoisomerase-1
MSKDREPDSMTLEECLAALEAAPDKRGKKKATKKKAAKKKAGRKKTTNKKAAKKKTAKKRTPVKTPAGTASE